MTEPYILWFGSLSTSTDVPDNTVAMSPAADRWQRALAKAITEQGVGVEVVSYVARPIWPRGPFTLGAEARSRSDDGLAVRQIGYRNLPFWRVAALTGARIAAGLRRARSGAPRAIVTFNAHPNTTLAAGALRALTKAPWLCLVADLRSLSPGKARSPMAAAEWLALASADARIYLSAALAPALDRPNDVHVDGGVDAMREFTPGRGGTAIYAGALTKGAGVDLAIEAFHSVRHRDAHLTVYGKGDVARVRRLAAGDQRITVKGLVSRVELAAAMASARVLLNPRLPEAPENTGTFPSKVLDYLAFGKPIVSTWTPGLAESYRDLLYPAKADAADFAAAIDRCLALDNAGLADRYALIRAFATGHTWTQQAERVLAVVERLRRA